MFIEVLKAILFGIIEGITEWLPVSSTGHLILLDEVLRLNVSDAFKEMFDVVIQLGAILAVLIVFFHKLNPFSPKKDGQEKKQTWSLWLKVIVAVLPSAVIGLLLDGWFNATFYNYYTVGITLILYGVIFIVIERKMQKPPSITDVNAISYRTALIVGLFQVLAIIPGTSRSGSTIIGGMLVGCSRFAVAEFSFFLAIPTMLGASLLKVVKFALEGVAMTYTEIVILAVGCITAFAVSMLVIKFLMDYVKKHTFVPFGIYRVALGVAVLGIFAIKALA